MGSNSGRLLLIRLRLGSVKCTPNCQTQYQSLFRDYFCKISVNYRYTVIVVVVFLALQHIVVVVSQPDSGL